MMIGHQFIFKEFGVKPTIGWDIDTFGHSDTNNRLYAEMGFDAMFFSRLDRDEKDQRSRERKMTYLWRPGHNHFGNQNQILTYVFPGDYCYPEGFSSGEFYHASASPSTGLGRRALPFLYGGVCNEELQA